MNSILIRSAEMLDINPLAELFDGYRIFYNKDSDFSGAVSFLSDRIKNRDSEIFIAQEDKLLVGFVQLYPLYSSTRMKRLWLLNDLFVLSDFRGKGVSKLLIDRSKVLCIQSDSCGIILETAKSNAIGNQLYPSTGFELDIEHNYYSWNC